MDGEESEGQAIDIWEKRRHQEGSLKEQLVRWEENQDSRPSWKQGGLRGRGCAREIKNTAEQVR